jgi:intein-encoded DNA endonuclease-like protein
MLEKWSNLTCGKMSFGKRFNTYKTRLHSVKASKFLKQFDINKILDSGPKTIGMFIKGFFDSEGTISAKKYTIRAFNSDFDTIRLIEKLLLKIGIIPSDKYYPIVPKTCGGKGTKTVYSISIYNKKNFRIFKKLAGFSIKRKRDALDKICG